MPANSKASERTPESPHSQHLPSPGPHKHDIPRSEHTHRSPSPAHARLWRTILPLATASSSHINLTCQPSTTAGVACNLYMGTSSGSISTLIATGLSTTSYQVTGFNASTTYYFTVTAASSSGASAPSNQASTTTSAPATTTSSCQVTYVDQNDCGVGFTGAITITRTTQINSWTLTWAYSGNQTLTQSGDGNYTQERPDHHQRKLERNHHPRRQPIRHRLQRQLQRRQHQPSHLLPQRRGLPLTTLKPQSKGLRSSEPFLLPRLQPGLTLGWPARCTIPRHSPQHHRHHADIRHSGKHQPTPDKPGPP